MFLFDEKWDEVLAVASLANKSDEELLPILRKLHQNLGHPPNHDLIRILRHGQASDQALRLAKSFSCDFCKTQSRPSVPLPAQPKRVSEVNQLVGLDVKYLKGWKPNQKVKSLNLVDYASGYQRVIPFFEQETSQLVRKLFEDHWVSWLGPPRELVLPGGSNSVLGTTFIQKATPQCHLEKTVFHAQHASRKASMLGLCMFAALIANYATTRSFSVA